MMEKVLYMDTLVIPTDAPHVQGPRQGEWTLADWQRLPDDGSIYEVINGSLYMSTAPSFYHQWIVGQFHALLGVPSHQRGLGFAAFAPIGVIMPGAEPVQPDWVFVRRENASIIRDRHIYGVPDLVIEVMSPGSAAYDDGVKKAACAAAGVPEYGIADPKAGALLYYRLEAPGVYAAAQVFSGHGEVRFACLPGIVLVVDDLFAGAPDKTL